MFLKNPGFIELVCLSEDIAKYSLLNAFKALEHEVFKSYSWVSTHQTSILLRQIITEKMRRDLEYRISIQDAGVTWWNCDGISLSFDVEKKISRTYLSSCWVFSTSAANYQLINGIKKAIESMNGPFFCP